MRARRRLAPVMLVSVLMLAFFVVCTYYNPVAPTFPEYLRSFTPLWKTPVSPEPTTPAGKERPRAFYQWTNDSGQILDGIKPPVHGVFVLLDLDSSSYVTSHRDGDTLTEQLIDHDLGFSNCHQVTTATLSMPIIIIRSLVTTSTCPDKRESWHGRAVRSPVPTFTFIGATCRPCGAKKTIFGPVSKNNTGMAALRADLPTRRPAGNKKLSYLREVARCLVLLSFFG